MNITEIVVSAGRTFNHPHEEYSNLKPQVTLKAAIAPEDDPAKAVKDLQAMAEGMVEDHKQSMLKSISDLHQLSLREGRLRGLERQLRTVQEELNRVRADGQGLLPETSAVPAGDAQEIF